MAVTFSGLFLATWQDMVDATQLAVDLDAETHKGALYANTITPNFSDTAANAAFGAGAFASGEVFGTGWATGGVALTTTVLDIASLAGSLVFDAADVSVAGTTLTNARCYLLYADALAGNNAIVLVNFGADFSTVNGTFGIQWAAPASGGVFNIDLTP